MELNKCPVCGREEKYVLIEGDVWHHMCKSNCTKKGIPKKINNMDQDTFDYIKKRGEDGC